MKPVEIAKGVFDVGVNDWNIRDFHGYSTDRGTSYNAFLVMDEKIALIDTVKKEFTDQLLDNIAQVVDPQKIDYVISNHTEMDHSGGLPRIMHHIGEDKPLFCSTMGQKNLSLHFSQPYNYHSVTTGDELNLGHRRLQFIETRMLHWPDSMFTYSKTDKILFSSDAFGQHFAGYEKFDDVIGEAIMPFAKKYFANILLPYAPLIEKLIATVNQMNLEIDMICPDHGILWRGDPLKIIHAYRAWSVQEAQKKALIVYDTMWESTRKMAEAIGDGLTLKDVDVRLMHLRKCHRSDIMTEVLDARAIIVGSPTLNNGLFPTVADFLSYMKGLKPKNKIAAAFGSYGWSGEAVKLINQEFEPLNFSLVDSGLKSRYVPDAKVLEACVELGQRIGKMIME